MPFSATVFMPAGAAHTFSAGENARCLIAELQSDRDPARQHEIYLRFVSELLE